MNDDAQLLHAYVGTGSDAAFAGIVERYKGLVYASALRQTGDAGLAEEITQAVFIVLARKAAGLKSHVILSGWLFRTTHFAARDALKSERRRQHREHEAALMKEEDDVCEGEAAWQEIAPVLDESLARLGETDRHALLLRFFEQKNLAEVGRTLGLSEDAARKRVQRALEKLRGALGKRGVAVTATMLSMILAANAAPAAPLTITVGATATAATASLVKGTLALMAWSKTKITMATIGALLLVNSAVFVVVRTVRQSPDEAAPAAEMPAPGGAFSEDEVVLTTFTEPAPDDEGFISLFNGRDLSGWNYNPHVWSVADGAIVARAPVESRTTVHYIAWAGGRVQDLELRLKVRTTADANSGVPIRARWGEQRWFPGYQVEIHGQRSGLFVIAGGGRERQVSRAGWRTIAREENGSDILDSVEPLPEAEKIDAARAAVQRGEWCDVTVVAQGTRFIIKVNGATVVDTHDDHPTKFVPVGMLGLEYSHRRGTNDAVEFKDIRIKR